MGRLPGGGLNFMDKSHWIVPQVGVSQSDRADALDVAPEFYPAPGAPQLVNHRRMSAKAF